MRRRTLLGGLTGGALAAGLAAHGSAAAHGQRQRGGQGIGLTREEWEDLHGPAVVGQSLASYENERYFVGLDDGLVTFIERGWEAEGNVPFAAAEAEVLDLLPADARLAETFVLPATAGGPISFLVARYRSDDLDDALGSARTDAILVLYQETPSAGRMEKDIARVSIAVGTEP